MIDTSPQSMSQPLWPDAEITHFIEAASDHPTVRLAMRGAMHQVRTQYETDRQRLHARMTELRNAATAALGWIDYIYPPDIFIGLAEDADEGVVMIAMIRENLRQALKNEA